ncbi:hypothetical protein [Lactococcus lactis]|nr:hypothetical protein [Lactococcus lactis]BDH82989.1 hypothetical protein LLID5_02740 [Lactococcus lactis]
MNYIDGKAIGSHEVYLNNLGVLHLMLLIESLMLAKVQILQQLW